MHPSSYQDTFARDHLPPKDQQPEFIFTLPELQFPSHFNAAVEILDRQAEKTPHKVALIAEGQSWTYQELQERSNQIAHVLSEDLDLAPGNRVLLHGANTPMLAATWFGIIKAGGIVVSTMPLLRAPELIKILNKAQISHAVADVNAIAAVQEAQQHCPSLKHLQPMTRSGGELLEKALDKPTAFTAIPTASDDIALISFTSGTTGQPKGCMHFHRNLIAICETFAKHILQAREDDIFIGSPPFGFTFGLGALLLFPLRIGATAALLENGSPPNLLASIEKFKATICFTAPTSYRMMSSGADLSPLKSLRKAVSAGEALPAATRDMWLERMNMHLIDGIGATEMLHIFISATEEDSRSGFTGKAIPGFKAKVVNEHGEDAPAGEIGRLAIRGPTGCLYLADERQKNYVQNGWNFSGDLYIMSEDGYFQYVSRSDDMIISSGYNIGAPEVENALLSHSAVAECAVVGIPDELRGQIVKAYIVLASGVEASDILIKELQDHVKNTIAPYKYPRDIAFCTALPKTASGKLQRFQLKQGTA